MCIRQLDSKIKNAVEFGKSGPVIKFRLTKTQLVSRAVWLGLSHKNELICHKVWPKKWAKMLLRCSTLIFLSFHVQKVPYLVAPLLV